MAVLPILYAVGLYAAYLAGVFYLRGPAQDAHGSGPAPSPAAQPAAQPQAGRSDRLAGRVPLATLALALAVAVPAALQLVIPSLLLNFARDRTAILAGEWWRLVTALFFQDGGVPGTIFNLVTLLLVGSVAERVWGSRRMLLIYLAGGLISQLPALAWQPTGAGNSVANFSLAGSIALVCLLDARRPLPRICAALACTAAAGLLLLQDIHGAAFLLGLVLAVLLRRLL